MVPYDVLNHTYCCLHEIGTCFDSDGNPAPDGFELVQDKIISNLTAYANSSHTDLVPWKTCSSNDSPSTAQDCATTPSFASARSASPKTVGLGIGVSLGICLLMALIGLFFQTSTLRKARNELDSLKKRRPHEKDLPPVHLYQGKPVYEIPANPSRRPELPE